MFFKSQTQVALLSGFALIGLLAGAPGAQADEDNNSEPGSGIHIGPPGAGVSIGGGKGLQIGTDNAGVKIGGGEGLRIGTDEKGLKIDGDGARAGSDESGVSVGDP